MCCSYVNLKPAKCPLDLGDGSERAAYVNQDYIISVLGRPHRCVNLMYTYYPNDKEWPARSSVACADMEVSNAWDYPYDDYFPYGQDGEPFNQIRDIRRHGQDVMLTITMDTKVSDEQLRQIGRDLKPFGRLRLRINHECDGTWFTHNKRNTYQEIGDFFVRASRLIKEEAPNILTVFCAGMIEGDDTNPPHEENFVGAYNEADIFSTDRYMALHYGWPYDVAEEGGGQYYASAVDTVYETFVKTQEHLVDTYGQKDYILGEFNTDGDVTGGFFQPDSIERFYKRLISENADHINGISMYQFRDQGRLGLELEDPNNASVGIRQPLFDVYKKLIYDPYFMPQLERDTDGAEVTFPVRLRFGGGEDAMGISLDAKELTASLGDKNDLSACPVFFEITCDAENTLMIEYAGRWFYKGAGVETIDLMPVFYEAYREGRLEELLDNIRKNEPGINIFVTPRDGVNDIADSSDDFLVNYYDVIKTQPQLRVRFRPCELVG